MTQTTPEPLRRSRLFVLGTWVTGIGALVSLAYAAALARIDALPPMLDFALSILGLGAVLGPALLLIAYFRHRRATITAASPSPWLWVPLGGATLILNVLLGWDYLTQYFTQDQLPIAVLSQTLLLPGAAALLALIPRSWRSLGNSAKVFTLVSLFLTFTYLSSVAA